ncbi:MAG: ComEC/Rec2 family competence protein, partial [Kiloniellales bacterium]
RPAWRGACLIGVLMLGSMASGFAVAQWRTAWVTAPTLSRSVGPVELVGQVVGVERLPKGVRLVLDRPRIPGLARGDTPVRVRLRLSTAQAAEAAIGEWVVLRAMLRPPPPPAAPGAFDFQRYAYFLRLGGVGFALGAARRTEPPEDARPGGTDAWRMGLARLRTAIADRVRGSIDGPAGTVAAALMTGDRRAIPDDVLAAMRDSGLAHLLAISGLHIGLVAAILFFGVRAALALMPALALRFPIKKWAAVAALVGAFGYLLMSGATVPTQRAFLMVGLVLFAVLIDRTAISMRLVAWAALIVLLIAPESVLGPSFQMSFAAVIALIAAYEGLGGRFLAWRGEAGIGRRVVLYLMGVGLTTIVAMAATAPFAVYHFNRFAAYGLAANLVAVPLTALWIMPWALAAFCLMPIGLDALALMPMSWGIEVVIAVAYTVAGWPGAVRLVPAMPAAALVVASLGGLWLCLWQGRWRYLGLAAVALGLAGGLAVARPPDILVSHDAGLMALRLEDGTLAFSTRRRAKFTREMWLRRAGQSQWYLWPRDDPAAGDDTMRCDPLGCVWRPGDRRIAFAFDARALGDDCRLADLIVSAEPVARRCRRRAQVIDRFDVWRHGAHAVWLDDGGGFLIETVADRRGIRPWAPARPRGRRQEKSNR